MNRTNFMLIWIEHGKSFITSRPEILVEITTVWDKRVEMQGNMEQNKPISSVILFDLSSLSYLCLRLRESTVFPECHSNGTIEVTNDDSATFIYAAAMQGTLTSASQICTVDMSNNPLIVISGCTPVSSLLTLVLLNPKIPCLCKQCRSRSVGFWRSQLIWSCIVCH